MTIQTHSLLRGLPGNLPVEDHRLPLLELLFSSFLLVPVAEQNHLKSCTESLVAQGIAHGIDRTVDIAQPVAHCPQGHGDATPTERID